MSLPFNSFSILELFLDTHVQIILRDSTGEEIVSKQTITRYAQHHPIYAERYLFNIHENSLEQITLVIAVVQKRSSTNQMDPNFGSIAFGRFSLDRSIEKHLNCVLFQVIMLVEMLRCLIGIRC